MTRQIFKLVHSLLDKVFFKNSFKFGLCGQKGTFGAVLGSGGDFWKFPLQTLVSLVGLLEAGYLPLGDRLD